MRKDAVIERRAVPPEIIRETLRQCAASGVDAVSFTGGEPFINQEAIFSLLAYAQGLGIPYLRSGTNGYMFADNGSAAGPERMIPFVEAVVSGPLRNFWISMDSAGTAVHERLRGLPGVIDGITKALPLFHGRGFFPAANLGINRYVAGAMIPGLDESKDEAIFIDNYRRGFAAFFDKALSMGFTMANVCYPMSFDTAALEGEKAAYGAISGDIMVSYSPRELELVFGALLDVIPSYRKLIRIFTPLSVLYALSRPAKEKPLFPCLGGICYFYMDSRDARIYPCGYRGAEDLGSSIGAIRNRKKADTPFCGRCHWECFRDPSQLFGIARYLVRHPFRQLSGRGLDSQMVKLWREDVKYYLDCGLFDGRRRYAQ